MSHIVTGGGIAQDLPVGPRLGGNDVLDRGAGNDTLTGGTGDDRYIVDSLGDVVTENANEGADTVWSFVNYTLAADLELLTLMGSNPLSGTGNARANRITGNSGNNTLNGMGGNDELIGSDGNDRFVFSPGSGQDRLTDFVAGGIDDTLDFSAYAGTGITYTLAQVGADAVFQFSNGDRITLVGVDSADLVQVDPWGWG